MASLQLAPYTGGRRKVVHGRSGGRSSSAAPVKQLLSRLRSAWRRRAARPRPRRAAARFAYDLQSYRQNFDDGLAASSGHRRL
ncbi:hypothetical protein HU200_022190 [Digitaria exilis]|uniref:Uncharacterized protein n=1 Tax=Digitaria exilis TaxID=1010633 RepID=A0A835C3K8_9POAL|nr:hypothetical protein HU200_022190 [Digitaria exilis]